MAFVSSEASRANSVLRTDGSERADNAVLLPDLLRCMVFTWSPERAEFLQSIAESELWKTTARLDSSEFLRDLFRLQFPLVFADMPEPERKFYSAMKHAVTCAADMRKSQLIVCGQETNAVEEIWARSLGAWAYLPGEAGPQGLEQLFGEARKSIAKQATNYMELASPR